MFRRNRDKETHPAPAFDTLAPRWRRPVDQAIRARDRFAVIARGTAEGPTRERLETLAARLDAGVEAATEIARRADATERTVDALDPGEVGDRLKSARRRVAQSSEADPSRSRLQADVDALAEQFASLNRLQNRLDEASDQLDALELRMETAVARAAELALAPGEFVDPGIGTVVDELTALQAAMQDLR
jgi:hypothetical protein